MGVLFLALLFLCLIFSAFLECACAHIRAHKRYNRYLFIILYIYRKQECNYRKAEKGKKRKGMEGWNDRRMEGWKDGRMEGWKDGMME